MHRPTATTSADTHRRLGQRWLCATSRNAANLLPAGAHRRPAGRAAAARRWRRRARSPGVYARTDAHARRVEGAGRHRRHAERRARPDAADQRPRERPAQPARRQLLRTFPAYGRVSWGARTLRGADAQADEYKYIPIRRLALFLEESLYRGTQWVVFEPNDEPLWAQIRLNRRRVHERPVPPGRVPGHARRRRPTSSSATRRRPRRPTATSASSTSWSASRRSSPPSSSSSPSSRSPAICS